MPPMKRSRQKSYECNQKKSESKHNNNHRKHHERETSKPRVQWKDEYKFSQNLFGDESSQRIYGGPSFQPMSPAIPVNHDKYCWKCHLSDTDCFCSKCTRSYHRTCATRKQDGDLSNDWKCGQCVQLTIAKSTSIECSKRELNELLSIVVVRLKSDPRAFNIDESDWRVLQQKVKNQHYDSTLELVVDMKGIDHKHAIEFEGSDSRNVMKQILEKCKSEITDLKMCGECYRNSNEDHGYFTNVCTARHKLIWAELKGYPYWPAKVMEFKDATTYKVQFFGKHDYAYVPISNTKTFTPRNPNTQLDEKARSEINACMPEALIYFEALKQAQVGNITKPFAMRPRVTSLLSSDNDECDDAEDEDSNGSHFGDTDFHKSNNRRSNPEIAHIKKQIDSILKDNQTIKNEMAEMNKRMVEWRAKCDAKLKTRCINCGAKATLLFLAVPFCKQDCVNHMWKMTQAKL